MKAVILAGGYGTRLIPLTLTIAKPMIPLVNTPVIEYIVDYLTGYGLNDIVITTNYQRERIMKYLKEKKDAKISFPEELSPLGTAGSVKNAGIEERMLIIQGDNITDIDIRKVINFHQTHGRLVTITLLPVQEPSLYGIAEIEGKGESRKSEGGRVKRYKEKPSPQETFSNLANTGLYVIEPEAMEYIPKGSPFDFSKDLFPLLVDKGEIYGCVVDGFWTDVGVPESYIEATKWILRKKSYKCADTPEIGTESEIRGDVAIGEHAIVEKSFIQGPAVIGNYVKIKESNIYNSIIFHSAALIETSLNNSIIGENVAIDRGNITKSIVGGYCNIKNTIGVASKIWPYTNIAKSVVEEDVKRFAKVDRLSP